MILVEIVTPTETIAFQPYPEYGGFVYDNTTLDAWYAQAEADAEPHKRPNAHGAFGLGQVFTKEHRPIISGQYFGTSATDAMNARNRLATIGNEGRPVTMRVTDELGATTRQVWLVARDAPFRHDFSHFPFDLAFIAPDSRRYGAWIMTSDGMPTGGSGLVWNLGTAPSGLYFDWGVAGVAGQVSFSNPGQAATFPRIEVGGPGALESGFRITEIETGRELTFNRSTNFGDVIALDSRTQRATISNGGGDVTGSMSRRQWFSVPAGATRRYQITPLGGVTGAPIITLYAAPAYL